jgi:hypothetical protein
LYASSNINHTLLTEEGRSAYKILVGTPEGMKTLSRSRFNWKGNVTMNIIETGWEIVDWIGTITELL